MSKKAEYDKNYYKRNIRRIVLNLNKETDRDIIEYLGNQINVQGTLKSLIREKIKKGQ